MFNLDVFTNKNNEKHNLTWLYIPDHPHRLVIIGCSGLRKTNAFFNLIKEQDSDSLIDKFYLHAKDVNKPKYQFIIKKREGAEIKQLIDPKAFVEYSAYMDDFYSNINDYNPDRKRKILILFDDMITDIKTNKKFQAIFKELIRYRKLNISLFSITQSCFLVQKDVRLN